jgi:glycosyltransferase involved in cell wall biosynthesis
MTRVLHLLPGLAVGGTEMALLRLVSSTHDIEHLVVTLTSHDTLKSDFEHLGVKVESLMMTRSPLTWIRVFGLRKIVREFVPDVVQSWLYAGDLALIFAGIKKSTSSIWNIRQSETRLIRGQFHIYVMQRIAGLVSNWLPDQIVYCGEKARATHESIGYSDKNAVVIPNGIDVEKYRSDKDAFTEIRQELGLADDVFVFGLIGRYDPLKNQQLLLDSFSQLMTQRDSVFLILAGRNVDDNNDELVKLVQLHGLQDSVQLLGARTDISRVLAALDCHVLTSTSEGWPNVLAEAMACEVFCITTPVGDAPTILNDCGTVLNDYRAETLAVAMLNAVDADGAFRKSAGNRARQRVKEEFSLRRFGERYQQLYIGASS